MKKQIPTSDAWSSRVQNSTVKLAIWTGAWVLTVAVATFGPEYVWSADKGITIAAILLNLCIGAGVILANIRYLKQLDEMMQKLQLEAMGLALGIGIVGGISYSLLDITDVIPFDAEIGHLVILISLAYLAGLGIGQLRYR